jgi:hypothetical protein
MHDMEVKRLLQDDLLAALKQFPAVGLVGSRQVGKTTLARKILQMAAGWAVYVDLQLPSDLAKLTDPESFLSSHASHLVILDEIHRLPELFGTLRALIDRDRRPGRFLVVGSTSPDLLRQGSESLAGRIRYLELTPVLLPEVAQEGGQTFEVIRRHWWRGGYPDSYLASGDEASRLWRGAFTGTFLEREVPQLGFRVPAVRVRRFWEMLAHLHGQPWNASRLAGSLDVTPPTAKHYLDILTETLLVRQLPPLHANVKKRLVKSPKVYLRDSGLLHGLLRIDSPEEMWGHPSLGASFEGYVLEQILATAGRDADATYYRTSSGQEVDLVLTRGTRRVAIDIQHTSTPRLERGFAESMRDIGAARGYVVGPIREAFKLREDVLALPVGRLEMIAV